LIRVIRLLRRRFRGQERHERRRSVARRRTLLLLLRPYERPYSLRNTRGRRPSPYSSSSRRVLLSFL